MIAAGLPLALATDYNRFHPSGNMNFVVATACIKMKMTLRKPSMPPSMEHAMGISRKYNCW
jgi:imidazolonepropionase